jgi:hypothetical protein
MLSVRNPAKGKFSSITQLKFEHDHGCIFVYISVADPRCLSRIPDRKTATKERGEKKLVVIPFLAATNFTKF